MYRRLVKVTITGALAVTGAVASTVHVTADPVDAGQVTHTDPLSIIAAKNTRDLARGAHPVLGTLALTSI